MVLTGGKRPVAVPDPGSRDLPRTVLVRVQPEPVSAREPGLYGSTRRQHQGHRGCALQKGKQEGDSDSLFPFAPVQVETLEL